MDELAGLRDSAPPTINSDPTSPELASKTGLLLILVDQIIKKVPHGQTPRCFGITMTQTLMRLKSS